MAREPEGKKRGENALLAILERRNVVHPPFAPPFLKAGRLVIAQTANILFFLGNRHGLAPRSEAGRLWTLQLQLTIADLVAEIHDCHHPVSGGLFYEDQKPEAARRAKSFRGERLPKYLGYFDAILRRNGKGRLVGSALTYADLSLFQVVDGLRYAFPKVMRRMEKKHTALTALHEHVAARPRIASYLKSHRRVPFSTEGIFRHYPELDA